MSKKFNKYPPKIQKFCELCGAEYFVYPYRKDTAKYCSNKCSGTITGELPRVKRALRKANLGNKYRHNSLPLRFCEYCNKELHTHQKRFCSNSCASKILIKDPERNRKIGEFSKNRIATPETIEKLKLINKGRVRSAETRQKLRVIGLAKAAEGSVVVCKPSKPEIHFGIRIKDIYGINLKSSKWIEGRCFDYEYHNYLFELDGDRWHRLPYQIANDKLKNDIAKRNNYILYRFRLNRVKDVDSLIEQNKELLENIFKEELNHVI
jgi:hypothetical protein